MAKFVAEANGLRVPAWLQGVGLTRKGATIGAGVPTGTILRALSWGRPSCRAESDRGARRARQPLRDRTTIVNEPAPPECLPISESDAAHSARDSALGALEHLLGIIGELGEELLHLLVGGGIDIEIGLLRLGQEFAIAHGILERLAQDRQTLRRGAGRTRQGTAQQFRVEVELEHLPVVFRLDELEDAGDRAEVVGRLRPHLDDQLEPAFLSVTRPQALD